MQPITNLSEGTGYAGAYPAHVLNYDFWSSSVKEPAEQQSNKCLLRALVLPMIIGVPKLSRAPTHRELEAAREGYKRGANSELDVEVVDGAEREMDGRQCEFVVKKRERQRGGRKKGSFLFRGLKER